MGQFFANLIASVKIFFSNFNATFGFWINLLLVVAVVAFFGVAVVRCFVAGVKSGRNRKALGARQPDAEMVEVE